MKYVYLLRHAQSHPSDSVHHSEWPLSDRGRRQARALAAALGALDIDEIHTSPFRRCVETVRPFAEARGLRPRVADGLRERLVAQGLIDDFWPVWERSWADFDFALPGCETSRAAQHRIQRAVETICAASAATRLLVSSHGNVLSLLINTVEPGFGIEQASALRNPDLLRMTYVDGRLAWDREFALPALDELATCADDTPMTRTSEPSCGTPSHDGPGE